MNSTFYLIIVFALGLASTYFGAVLAGYYRIGLDESYCNAKSMHYRKFHSELKRTHFDNSVVFCWIIFAALVVADILAMIVYAKTFLACLP